MNEGSRGFKKKYWDDNYSVPDEMDGIGNVDAHIRYIKSMFDVEQIKLLSVADLGFGLGYFLQTYCQILKPKKIIGIEPSNHAFKLGRERILTSIKNKKHNITLQKTDISSWCNSYNAGKSGVIDLGICTSVFQYLSEDDIDYVIPILSQSFRYLYLSVPTDIELKRQVCEVEFCDQFALARSKSYYYKAFNKYFTFVSQRLLESKQYYDQKNTPFTDLLFRF